jgi:hypothetical protein
MALVDKLKQERPRVFNASFGVTILVPNVLSRDRM